VETKDVIGFILIVVATGFSLLATCLSRRIREVAFFIMVAGMVVSDRFDINFFSHFWYRGTTRGFEVSLMDILAFAVLVSSFLFPRRGESRWCWPAGLGLMLLYFIYALGSAVSAEPQIFGLFEASKMVRGLLIFMAAALFVRGERELTIFVFAICCAMCFEGLLAIKQRAITGVDRVSGSLDHANSLSMYICMVAPIFVAAINSTVPKWLRWLAGAALALATLTIVLTVSRAGAPTFAITVLGATAFCATWKITFKKVVATFVIVLGLAGIGYKFMDELKERYTESTLNDEYLDERVIDSRGYYLRLARIIVEDRFFGVGLNNWSYWVSKRYGAEVNTPYADYDNIPPDLTNEDDNEMLFAAPAHNLGALTVGEMGIPGLVLLALVWLRWFQMGATFLWKKNRTAMRQLGIGILFAILAVFLQSLTEWTFRQTQIHLTFHAALGVLASLYSIRRKERKALAAQPAFNESQLPYELEAATAA
jgi:hypothetical protein